MFPCIQMASHATGHRLAADMVHLQRKHELLQLGFTLNTLHKVKQI